VPERRTNASKATKIFADSVWIIDSIIGGPMMKKTTTFPQGALFSVSGISLVFCIACTGSASALVSSLGGTSIFNGVYINEVIGADAFYNQGFFGQNAVVANIEAGAVWGAHESTTGRISQSIYDPSISATSLGQVDWHATMVGQALGGSGLYTYQDGIASGATIWAGSIATQWVGDPLDQYVGGFSITDASVTYAYRTAMQTGINGVRADVINSSWGYDEPTGADAVTVMVDALIRNNGVVGVFAAGNTGPNANTVGAPATGYNGISVAALTNSASNLAYDRVADFSSRGRSDFYNPQTETITPNARATVDIAAPGDHLTLAFYGGMSGGHIAGIDSTGGNGQYYISDMAGTSFAAPIVAGAAALMIDAGKSYGVAEMTHPLVIKSVMMASASPTVGWDNGQFQDGTVTRTLQALDLASGAGALDLQQAHTIYLGNSQLLAPSVYATDGLTTLGVAGNGGSSAIASSGWDLGSIQSSANIYTLAQSLAAGSQFSAVLTWFAERDFTDDLDSAVDLALSNLSLELWRLDELLGDVMIGRSEAPIGTAEHLRMTLSDAGQYEMRVIWEGQNYNINNTSTATPYGLAWSFAPIPEPSVGILAFVSFFVVLRRRR
jgi:hypothetical protein